MADDNNNQDMMVLFQQFLKQQTDFFANQATSKRQLPLIEKIKRQEDFPVWRDRLIRVLQRHELDKYILTDVPAPEGQVELKKWRNDRADVDDYLQAVIGDLKVLNGLKRMGWKATDNDPKITFDKLTQYFEGGTVDNMATMHQELACIRRNSFASMEAFQSRVNYLKARLQTDQSAFKMPDAGYTWLALKGIEQEYPDLYNRCVALIHTNTLDWSSLMEEFQRIEVTESSQRPSLTNVKIDKAADKGKEKDKEDENDNRTCKSCQHPLKRGFKHCKGCNNHIYRKHSTCWYCEPEQAPDTWVNKTKAVQAKAERQRSTTAPLHQQSGIANASTTNPPTANPPAAAPNTKSVLFTTNLSALPSITLHPSFQ